MAMLLCLRKDTGSGQDRWQRQCRVRRRQLHDHIVEAAGNLCLEGVEMGGQFQVIRDDRLDADTGEAFINSEAAIGHHNSIFQGKPQLGRRRCWCARAGGPGDPRGQGHPAHVPRPWPPTRWSLEGGKGGGALTGARRCPWL